MKITCPIQIRREAAEDFASIHQMVTIAFQTAEVTSGAEQDLVTRLRAGSGYIPQLALIAKESGATGELVGHIMLTATKVSGQTGEHPILFLGPVAVKLEKRAQGIGSALIREFLRIARELGHRAVFLVGNPAYYHRFGFQTSEKFGIRHRMEIPAEFVMVCELEPGALAGVSGTVDC